MNGSEISSLAILAYGISAALLLAYAIGGSIEFGAGLFYAWSRLRLARLRADRLGPVPVGSTGLETAAKTVLGFMSPVWETTNVFLIAFMVSMVAFFPASLPFYSRAFFLPGAAGLLFLVLRGASFTYIYLNRDHHGPLMTALFGISSLLAPAFFSLFVALSAGAGPASAEGLAASPLTWLVPLLTLAYLVQLGGSMLAYYQSRQERAEGDGEQEPGGRRRAGPAGWFGRAAGYSTLAAIVLFLAFAAVLRAESPRLGQALWTWPAVAAWVVALALAGLGASWQLRAGRPAGPGRPGAALAVHLLSFALLFVTGAAAHLPYLVEAPKISSLALTVQQALVNARMVKALLLALGLGLVTIIPWLVWLYRLFLFTGPPASTRATS